MNVPVLTEGQQSTTAASGLHWRYGDYFKSNIPVMSSCLTTVTIATSSNFCVVKGEGGALLHWFSPDPALILSIVFVLLLFAISHSLGLILPISLRFFSTTSLLYSTCPHPMASFPLHLDSNASLSILVVCSAPWHATQFFFVHVFAGSKREGVSWLWMSTCTWGLGNYILGISTFQKVKLVCSGLILVIYFSAKIF